MSTMEKALGVGTAVLAVLGGLLTVFGIVEAGIISGVLVVLYGLFLLAQLLREARLQKRSTELLRESARLSRVAIGEARLESVHARNDIVGHARKIRAQIKDQARRSNRRDTELSEAVYSLGDQLDTESTSLSNTISSHSTKEARGTRSVVRELAGNNASRLIQAEELLTAQMEARTRQIRRQVVTERTAIVAELAKAEASLENSLSTASEGVKLYQQVTTQKLIAQQDGLRHVMDLARGAVAGLDASVALAGAKVEDVEQRIDRLAGDARSLSEQANGVEQEIGLLTDNARALSEQVLNLDERVVDAGARVGSHDAPSMSEIGERVEALRDRIGESEVVQDIDIGVTVAAHKEALERLRMTLQEVRCSGNLPEDEQRSMLATLYAQLGMQDVKQEFVLDINTYDVGISFRAQMVRLMHLKESLAAQGYKISPRENDKLCDREFAEALGIPTPSLLFYDVPSDEVVLEPNSIIKPTVGESSLGVFYVRPDLNLVSLKTRNVYATFAEAAGEYERWSGASREPRWIGERAILDESGEPARDVKVFMFYGEVGLFVEIFRGGSKILTATYDETGRRIIYRDTDDPHRDEAIPDGVVEFATRLSLAAPVPFLRVDFLVGADGPVLGEITPHPGGIYVGDANDDADRRHGRMFLEADARLTIDQLNGKRFSTYLEAYGIRHEKRS